MQILKNINGRVRKEQTIGKWVRITKVYAEINMSVGVVKMGQTIYRYYTCVHDKKRSS